MQKKILILLFIFLICYGCQIKESNLKIEYPEGEALVEHIDRKDNPQLPNFTYGRILEPYKGKDKAENNMIRQVNTYSNALLRGDTDAAREYFYKDATVYYRNYYPNSFSDTDIENDFFKNSVDSIAPFCKKAVREGLTVDNIVFNIERKISFGETLIMVFNIVTTIYNEKMSIFTSPNHDSITIGISLNNGKNWSFLALTDDSPNILRLRFDKNIINHIMDY